tara:strand:- start:319 stop:1413 length:1095 start_codon:yes stop_codon:yes gene_type:complete
VKIAIINLYGKNISFGYLKYLERVIPIINKKNAYTTLYFDANTNSKTISVLSKINPSIILYKNTSQLKKMINSNNTDIVFIPNGSFINFGKLPVIVMLQNMEPFCDFMIKNSFMIRLRNFLNRVKFTLAAHKSDKIIAVSEHVKDIVKNKILLDPRKISVIYHGTDIQKINYIYKRNRQSTILTVGSIRAARGLEDIIKALSIIKKYHSNTRLIVAGSNDKSTKKYFNYLKKLAKNNNVEDIITWKGFINTEELNELYQNSDVYVMSSKTEACPNTALEAMANKCRIISTTNGPMPELFKDCSLYYKAGDWNELSMKILQVFSESDSKYYTSKNLAYKRSLDFNWEKCATNTYDEFKRLLEYNN